MDQPTTIKPPITFVADKRPNLDRVQQLLALSAERNHWANGGPVVQLLEQTLAKAAGVGPGRAVVACSNGTSAMHVLAGLHALRHGRPLRWAVSAFGFFTTAIGPFAQSLVLDCDDQGMLDLDKLANTPTDQFDGVCVTNVFGRSSSAQPYADFCRQNNKPLILDNALGLFGFDRSAPDTPDEMISLHHTKPWGFGEGGCIIVPKEDEETARSLINFGVGIGEEAARYACNAKLSDPAAAYIIDRIEQAGEWSLANGQQRQRITTLVASAGLPLTPFMPDPPPGCAQAIFTAPHPITEDRLANPHLVLRKYYRPPYEQWPDHAADLYARILNIPCHAGIATLSEETIVHVLEQTLGRD